MGNKTVEAALLREANERLILESVRAQREAESAIEAYQEVSRQAQHDSLTQLPNRLLLLDRLGQAIARAKRHGTRLAVLFIDLNKFKQINDTYGHGIGDEVLKVVAQRLTSSVRDSDTVSRHGGDEFLILVSEISETSDAALVATKIMTAVGAPARIGSHIFLLSASVGVSVYPEDGLKGEDLIGHADAAMYSTKQQKYGSSHVGKTQEHGGSPIEPPCLSQNEQAIVEYEAAQERLNETIRELTAEVEIARQLRVEAEAAARRQTEFMACLAHDLTMPLALPQESVAEIDAIGAEDQVVDMSSLIEGVITACRPGIEAREQHLLVQLPTQRPKVLGDPAQLAKAIQNLLENASKYTQAGGNISVLTAVFKEFLEVTVSDNGRGIDRRMLAGVFEPFVRGSHPAEVSGGGLGLGLALVRQIAEAHGGRITAASAGEGLGSQFLLTLPLVSSDLPHRVQR